MRRRAVFVSLLVACAAALATAAIAVASGAPPLPAKDPFYAYSGSLASTPPGAVLKTRTVTIAENGSTTPITATQVLYRTTGELGQPTATVTTIIRPATAAAGAAKIVAYQTAYDALGSQCDPSYTLQGGNSSYTTAQQEEQLILGYVSAGYTVVVPDYEGENLDWGAGQESGYGTLDAIRAAEHALGLAAAQTPVGMIGYSGGSIATEFASELAPTYAPELDIAGVAEGGVPVHFFHNLKYVNGSPSWSGVIPAVIVSVGRAFNVDVRKYLSPYGLKLTDKVKDECINDFAGAYPGLTYQKMLGPKYQNIFAIPVFVKIVNHLIMSRTGTPKGPLLIGVGNSDGTGDGIMVAADDEALAHTYCRRGVAVQFNLYSGDDHGNAAVPFERDAFAFLSSRLAGQSVQSNCASIGAGNSLAPYAMPSPPARVPGVRFQWLGARRRALAIAVRVWATTGHLSDIVVTLRRRGHLVARVPVARLTHDRRLVLLKTRVRLRRGRYTLTITHDRRVLARRAVEIR